VDSWPQGWQRLIAVGIQSLRGEKSLDAIAQIGYIDILQAANKICASSRFSLETSCVPASSMAAINFLLWA
jgi:hypothetical protein